MEKQQIDEIIDKEIDRIVHSVEEVSDDELLAQLLEAEILRELTYKRYGIKC